MLTFREFKENTLSSLKSKVAEALEVKKQEMARSMFNESKKYADGDWVVYDDYTGKVVKTFTGNNAGKEAVKFQKKEFSKGKNYVARLKSDYPYNESVDINEGEVAGWIAFYQGKKLEIVKGKDAKDLWSAKQFAVAKLKVPKSKQGLLAIKPAYNESVDINEGGRVYDPLTKKMVNRKSIKQQAGGPVTKNDKEVKDVGMSKHWLQKMLRKGDYVTCNKSGESGQIQNISGDKETIDIKWSKGGTSSRPINAVRPVMESSDLNEAPRPRLARPSKTANFVVHYKINGKEEEKFILVPNAQKAKEWVLNKISDAGGKGKLIKVTPIDESTDLNEGMGAFKAAAEVLKAFGGKKPSKVSDMMKFDSEIEKAAKKYDVSVDDILKVINK